MEVFMKRIMPLLFVCAVVMVIGLGLFQANTAYAQTVCDMATCNYCDPPATHYNGSPVHCYCDDIQWQDVTCLGWCEGICP